MLMKELGCLKHLRELRADGNSIDRLDGLEGMTALVKLSIQGNAVRNLDLTSFDWCVPVHSFPDFQ